jgi:hypothetical protein
MECLEYDIIAQSYTVGGEIRVDPQCNGWTAINNGDTLVRVNNIPLLPFPPGHPELTGAAIAIPGNLGEFFTGRIWIVFDALPGVNPLVTIIQKYYKPGTYVR